MKSVSSESSTRERDEADADEEAPFDDEEVAAQPQAKRTRLNVNVELLSDDLADAFEQFKLAIIAQRREGWRDTTRETVIECLDALERTRPRGSLSSRYCHPEGGLPTEGSGNLGYVRRSVYEVNPDSSVARVPFGMTFTTSPRTARRTPAPTAR